MREEKDIHIRKPYHTPLVEFEKVENVSLMEGTLKADTEDITDKDNTFIDGDL